MKRLIVAVSFAILAVPAFAFAADAPYEQNLVDRTLPNVENSVVAGQVSASAGATSAPSGTWATGVWAQDHNFIAPAQ